jgi:hypothetical protein
MASSFKTASARIVSHVPSSVRSWAGFHGPYLPGGRSRQGAPCRSLNGIALITCRWSRP